MVARYKFPFVGSMDTLWGRFSSSVDLMKHQHLNFSMNNKRPHKIILKVVITGATLFLIKFLSLENESPSFCLVSWISRVATHLLIMLLRKTF